MQSITWQKLIQADRHAIGDALQGLHFDLVIDTAYTREDVEDLLNALESYEDYVLISSSAVYPEYAPAPFTEETQLAENVHWGAYGTNKIAAETALMERNPKAYILRPPYLYGPMNNVYREAFVFDCALENRCAASVLCQTQWGVTDPEILSATGGQHEAAIFPCGRFVQIYRYSSGKTPKAAHFQCWK